MPARLIAVVIAALMLAFAPGCGEEVSLEAFNEVENGMDLTQVEDIMGGPGELQAAAGVGIGASGLTEMQGEQGDTRSYLWGDENVGVVVKFKDGRVYHKQKMGL